MATILFTALVPTIILAAAAPKPHIVMVVADDLGYDDLGHNSVMGNNGTTLTPAINELIDTGIQLTEYYTFKVRPQSSILILIFHPSSAFTHACLFHPSPTSLR